MWLSVNSFLLSSPFGCFPSHRPPSSSCPLLLPTHPPPVLFPLLHLPSLLLLQHHHPTVSGPGASCGLPYSISHFYPTSPPFHIFTLFLFPFSFVSLLLTQVHIYTGRPVSATVTKRGHLAGSGSAVFGPIHQIN